MAFGARARRVLPDAMRRFALLPVVVAILTGCGGDPPEAKVQVFVDALGPEPWRVEECVGDEAQQRCRFRHAETGETLHGLVYFTETGAVAAVPVLQF